MAGVVEMGKTFAFVLLTRALLMPPATLQAAQPMTDD